MKIHTIKLIFPFWLKWAERFVQIKIDTQQLLPNNIEGRSIKLVIVDEASNLNWDNLGVEYEP